MLENYGGEMRGWKFVGGSLFALAITIQIALLGATTAWTKDYDPAVMAYWVQAVGSIAAIFGAFYIGRRGEALQLQLAEESRWRILNERRSTVKALIDDAYKNAKVIEFSASKDEDFDLLAFASFSESGMLDSISQLRELPVFDLESGELVNAVLGVRRECESLLGHVKFFKEHRFKRDAEYPGDVLVKNAMMSAISRLDLYYMQGVSIVGGAPAKIEAPQFY
ncbi:hypothetical protein [Burkholderia multivorans]|uniref:hypothetical protein n=1 Tax=Burkholderia multivorans TaxID=87883 RepID=UPI0011B1E4A0|nr:hypothetical protein [Burkholderia multivorans]MDN7995949.1 hypothetical protein [Burkholderia multivorans]